MPFMHSWSGSQQSVGAPPGPTQHVWCGRQHFGTAPWQHSVPAGQQRSCAGSAPGQQPSSEAQQNPTRSSQHSGLAAGQQECPQHTAGPVPTQQNPSEQHTCRGGPSRQHAWAIPVVGLRQQNPFPVSQHTPELVPSTFWQHSSNSPQHAWTTPAAVAQQLAAF